VKVGLALLALGAGGSGVAYILFYGLVQRVAATQAAVVGYLIPVVAAILGWAVLDEHLGPELFVGLALILAGVAAVNGTLAAVWSAVRRTRRGDEERAMGQAAR
jgi:drug/metabolite transporter (DMT)-like permease